jgi:hypothetical protein
LLKVALNTINLNLYAEEYVGLEIEWIIRSFVIYK